MSHQLWFPDHALRIHKIQNQRSADMFVGKLTCPTTTRRDLHPASSWLLSLSSRCHVKVCLRFILVLLDLSLVFSFLYPLSILSLVLSSPLPWRSLCKTWKTEPAQRVRLKSLLICDKVVWSDTQLLWRCDAPILRICFVGFYWQKVQMNESTAVCALYCIKTW